MKKHYKLVTGKKVTFYAGLRPLRRDVITGVYDDYYGYTVSSPDCSLIKHEVTMSPLLRIIYDYENESDNYFDTTGY